MSEHLCHGSEWWLITLKWTDKLIHFLINLNVVGLLKMGLYTIFAGVDFTTHMASGFSSLACYYQMKYFVSKTKVATR